MSNYDLNEKTIKPIEDKDDVGKRVDDKLKKIQYDDFDSWDDEIENFEPIKSKRKRPV